MASSSKHRATAFVIDDHPGTLAAACEIIKEDFEILAALVDGDSAIDALSALRPDIVVLDIGLPGKDGFETARQVKQRARTTRIVFLTVVEDSEYASIARDMGGSYVVKRRMHTDLLTAAREAMGGNLFFSPILPPQPHG